MEEAVLIGALALAMFFGWVLRGALTSRDHQAEADGLRSQMKAYENLLVHYQGSCEAANERISHLLEQNQNLAERIATLRKEGLVGGESPAFVPTKRERPYSAELQGFLERLDTEEARLLVEEQIEQLRLTRMDDEQIYQIIRQGALP